MFTKTFNLHHSKNTAGRLIGTFANTDGLINCLRQPGQPHYQPPKSMVLNSSQLIKTCGTLTDPAAETESIGLSADAQLAAFFAFHL
jgi:hypothetical protein